MNKQHRAVTPVISTILLVAIVVILSSTIAIFVLDIGSDVQTEQPYIEVSGEFVEAIDDGEKAVAITLVSGTAVQTDRLYVIGSQQIDIGGPPSGTDQQANDAYASDREKFTESSGGRSPQVGIGDSWEAGETVYVDPKGSADHLTISIYWTSKPVEGVNPGTPKGQNSYKLITVEMGET
jgi:flagellin-like protein